jgi:predicted transcriptional regulator
VTQIELAERLEVGQAAISKIENHGDVQISSLQKYVHALGATLRIEATFSAKAIAELSLGSAFDADLQDDDQLAFPIFGDDLFRAQRDVVLSIRPNYSTKIMQGIKTVEVRRISGVSTSRRRRLHLFNVAVQAKVGSAEIAEVIKLPVVDIWKKFNKMAQIERSSFNEYFTGVKQGFALQFANVRPFSRSIKLAELRTRFAFEPPQSFLYATPLLRTALQDEYSNVSY